MGKWIHYGQIWNGQVKTFGGNIYFAGDGT